MMIKGAYVNTSQLLSLRFYPYSSSSAHSPRGVQMGARLSKIRGRGVDFAEVRTYQPGDDIRNIDWRVTARKNKPHTKIFREERERPTLIFIDQSQSMFFGSEMRLKSVAAAHLGALLAWRSLANGDRVGGIVVGNQGSTSFKPYRSSRRVARFVSEMASYNNALNRNTKLVNPEHNIQQLQQLGRLAKHNYRIYLISDFLNLDTVQTQEHIGRLSQHNEVVACRIYDHLEKQLPPAAHYAVTDGERRWHFNSGQTQLRAKYELQHQQFETRLQQSLQEKGVHYHSIATTAEIDNLDVA